jgi:uncharacterized RDD family membrane protein YckC
METEQAQYEYAGFWSRFAAYFIDGAIVAFLLVNMFWLVSAELSYYFAAHPDVLKALQGDSLSSSYDWQNKFMYYYAVVFSTLFNWIYFAGFESSHLRGTPGKWMLGIYVTDIEGTRVTFAQATGRHFGKIISGIILCIGYMMAGFTEHKQALHDMMAGCYVWKK